MSRRGISDCEEVSGAILTPVDLAGPGSIRLRVAAPGGHRPAASWGGRSVLVVCRIHHVGLRSHRLLSRTAFERLGTRRVAHMPRDAAGPRVAVGGAWSWRRAKGPRVLRQSGGSPPPAGDAWHAGRVSHFADRAGPQSQNRNIASHLSLEHPLRPGRLVPAILWNPRRHFAPAAWLLSPPPPPSLLPRHRSPVPRPLEPSRNYFIKSPGEVRSALYTCVLDPAGPAAVERGHKGGPKCEAQGEGASAEWFF